MKESFKPGELIIYQCGDRYEVGKIKTVNEDSAFVWYSTGETAAKTPFGSMHKIDNAREIGETLLGNGF